jgi:hypothetical protein
MTDAKKWEIVEAAWDDGYSCDGCSFYHSYPDRWDEPGGTECRLLEGTSIKFKGQVKPVPEDCAGFEHFKARLEEGP